MKLITFKYTKANGSISKRTLMPSIYPNTMYEGVDISELSTEDQVLMAMEVNAVHTAYLEAVKAIQDKYDVSTMYRRFDPSKMADMVVDIL